MLILDPEQMQAVDSRTIESGYPALLLMEAAGKSIADLIKKINTEKIDFSNKKTVIFCGKGNNGGDGFVTARFLDMYGFQVEVYLMGKHQDLQDINLTNYQLCRMRDISVKEVSELKEQQKEIIKKIKEADFVVEALLGTGLKGKVRGDMALLIDLINNRSAESHLIAADIPAGISGKTGQILGKAIRADYTATMAFLKTGLCLYPGKEYAGEIKRMDIGIPDNIITKKNYNKFMLNKKEAAALLPPRPVTGHKGTFGKICVLGGSQGMTGAPYLTGFSALKSGTGLVKIAVPRSVQPVIASYGKELMTVALEDDRQGISEKALPVIENLIKESDLIAAGPGLGRGENTRKIINFLLKSEIPLVLDADALNVINDLKILKNREHDTVLTPHPGEMAHLLNEDIKYIQNNRIQITSEFAQKYGLYLVLKGAVTTIGLPDGSLYINPTGNQGLATAGSGDVLTGIIAGLMAQGNDTWKAAVLGPYLHGMAGDIAVEKVSSYSLVAGDIIKNLQEVYNKLIALK